MLWAACALAALVGAKLCFGFGLQIGGAPVGFLLAANGALFGWLMVSAAADQALRLVRKLRPPG